MTAVATPDAARLVFAAVAGLILLLILIIKFKVHAMISILIGAVGIGLMAGMPLSDIIGSVNEGIGNTLKGIALLVGLGSMFGAILEESGGAQTLAVTMVRKFGDEKAAWALGITGLVVAMPVFFDAGLIILIPLAFSLAKRTKRSVLYYVIPLLAGLAVGHAFIPPTPGPVLVASMLGVDLGWVILIGIFCGIFAMIAAGPIWGSICGKKYMIEVPEHVAQQADIDESKLPKFGTIVGIIPATGGGTASWMSYNEARRDSKDPDSFGKGNIDGVIASETANNAVTGGALVPLLALGVPGDTVTAVLLGALMLQGVTPGPMLFVDHVDTVNGIYVLMIMANIFMCILGMVGVRLFLKVLKVPSSALTACVLALCCIGAFAVRGYTFDIKCALVLGVLGYLFTKTDYPIPPILLGLLLGSTVESNFRRAMSQTGGDWTTFFSRPISCVLLIISIIAFFYPVAKAIIHHFKAQKDTTAAE